MIDSHQHYWRYVRERDGWMQEAVLQRDYLPADFAPLAERHGVGGVIAVQADQSTAETDYLLALAERDERILGVVGWVDLRAPDLARRLERYAGQEKLVGFRHIVQAESPEFLLDEAFLRGMQRLVDGEREYTYDLLIDHRYYGAAGQYLRRVPEQLRIVIDHFGKPDLLNGSPRAYGETLQAFAQRPNTYLKLSGLLTEAGGPDLEVASLMPYFELALEHFGAGRCMYASDWPVCLLGGGYETQLDVYRAGTAGASAADQRLVDGETARRVYLGT